MPGLVGIIDSYRRGNIAGVLSKMAFSIKNEDWHTMEIYVDDTQSVAIGRVDLGILNPQKQPIFNETKTIVTFMYGEIYDYAHRKRELIEKTHQFLVDNDPEFLTHLYEELGESFVKGLNGSFVIVIFDKPNQRIVIANDRYGQRPLYYTLIKDRLIFSSEVKAILEDPSFKKAIDNEAIAEFLTFGQLLGDKTMVKEIHLQPPASLLIYNLKNGRFDLFKYWELKEHLKTENRPEKDCLEDINKRFTQAVKRMSSGNKNIAVGLSGGLDSRTIMAAIDCGEYPIKSYTIGIKGCTDDKLTRLISDKTGIEHIFCDFDQDLLTRYYDYEKRLIALTDGMWGLFGVLPLYSSIKCRSLGLEILINGNVGEIVKLDRAYQLALDKNILALQDQTQFLNYIFKKMSFHKGNIERTSLFTKTLSNRMDEVPLNSLKSILNGIDGDLPVEQKVSFLFISELFRRYCVPSLVIARNKTEVRLPFMDNDFLEVAFKIPPRWRTESRIHQYIIKRNNPNLLKIPSAQTMVRLDAGKIQTFLFSLPYKILKKLGYESYRSMYYSPENYIKKNLEKNFFEKILLDKKTVDHGYYNPIYIKDLVTRYAKGDKNLFEILELMVLFELWLRSIFD